MAKMTFTVEVELSDWANWVAQDFSGKWYEYEKRPENSRHKNDYWVNVGSSKYSRLSITGSPNSNWKQELYQVIKE